jgi:hypothetical protein
VRRFSFHGPYSWYCLALVLTVSTCLLCARHFTRNDSNSNMPTVSAILLCLVLCPSVSRMHACTYMVMVMVMVTERDGCKPLLYQSWVLSKLCSFSFDLSLHLCSFSFAAEPRLVNCQLSKSKADFDKRKHPHPPF